MKRRIGMLLEALIEALDRMLEIDPDAWPPER